MAIEDMPPNAEGPDVSVQASLREGDHGLGIPRSAPVGARVLSRDEAREHHERQTDELRREFQQKLRQLDPATSFTWPAGVRRVLTWTVLAVASLLGLIVVGQGAALIRDIEALPAPFDWIAGTSAVGFTAILGWLILKLGWFVMNLHRSPRVNLHALQQLQQRRQWQQLAAEHAEKARAELRSYLEGYELRAVRNRLADDEHERLEAARQYLLTEPMSAEEWLEAFRQRFQLILDDAAKRCAREYATKVGIGTALSRIPQIDQAIVLYSCVAMIKELMVIYGLRPAFGQTPVILARSILMIYLSGLLQDLSDRASDTVANMIDDSWTEVAGMIGQRPLSAIASGAAEGIVNGFLIWRLGKRTISQLQPVRTEDREA